MKEVDPCLNCLNNFFCKEKCKDKELFELQIEANEILNFFEIIKENTKNDKF